MKNQFIINQGIEQTVLMEDSEEGHPFIKSRPANVKMCFTLLNGDKRRGQVISLTGGGGVNISPIEEYRGQLRMQVDKDAQIRYVTCMQLAVRTDLGTDKKSNNSRLLSRLHSMLSRSLGIFSKGSTRAKLTKQIILGAANSCSTSSKRRKTVQRNLKWSSVMRLLMRPRLKYLRTN